MRLQIVREVLKLYKQDVVLHISTVGNDRNNKRVSGIQKLGSAIEKIEKIGIFTSDITTIKSFSSVYETSLDSLILDNNTCNQVGSLVAALRRKLNVLFEALTDYIGEEQEDTVLFKIPEVKDIGEISEILRKLKVVLEQTLVNEYIGGKVEFTRFQTGSTWLEILVGSTSALVFLGRIVDIVFNFRNDQLNFTAKEKMIEDLDMQLEIKKAAFDAIQKEREAT